MNDTHPAIEMKMQEMFEKKSPTERIEMGMSMDETSKKLIIQAILRSNPNLSKIQLKQEFFLKFYGDDFSPSEREKILRYLEKTEPIF